MTTVMTMYGTPAPSPDALKHDETRLVVWHYPAEHYEGTSALELHAYQLRTFQHGKRTRIERRTVGEYPLRWLTGYPEDHAPGECEACTQAYESEAS